MSVDENKTVMRRFAQEIVSGGDFSVFDQLISPAYVEYTPSPGVSPDREGFRQDLVALRTAFPDLRTEEVAVLAEDDRVVYHGSLSGTHSGPFMGMPPTEKRFRIAEMHIVRVVDGQFREHWGVFDALGMMQQLGAIPAQP